MICLVEYCAEHMTGDRRMRMPFILKSPQVLYTNETGTESLHSWLTCISEVEHEHCLRMYCSNTKEAS